MLRSASAVNASPPVALITTSPLAATTCAVRWSIDCSASDQAPSGSAHVNQRSTTAVKLRIGGARHSRGNMATAGDNRDSARGALVAIDADELIDLTDTDPSGQQGRTDLWKSRQIRARRTRPEQRGDG
jgi:hypothetical protein